MTLLLKDLIEIPERIFEGDFVLKLTEGIARPQETLRDYVVTPQLKEQFDNALSFVASSLQSNQSKAAFLHGSFGSGKSHFMAVLNLILGGEALAWEHPDLSPITSRYGNLKSKKFLRLAFHMINATSMEAKVLGGYVDAIRELHPECPVPAVFRSELLFQNARQLRQQIGDEPFLTALNSGKKNSGLNWGKQSASSWTADKVDEAMQAPPGNLQRNALVSNLLETLFSSYSDVQREGQESYVNFDEGLQIISAHAQALGYDAILLFLDELVLWLATMASNRAFVNQEVQKLVKLVEAERSNRAIPILSLIARQRDLKELIGDSITGFDQFNFHDQIRHFEKRFHIIPLEDTNLPEIVSRRILRPKSQEAAHQLSETFDRLNLKDEVRDILQDNYDLAAFRKVYPFSPALIDTLVAVSSLLQRNRTAILILMELLIQHRDTLTLGRLIPTGDLFDLVTNEFNPYSLEVRRNFETAKRLLEERFLPLMRDAAGNPNPTYETDSRLVKTVLLAALVPQVNALRKLTPRKLAALNHDVLKSPIKGNEAGLVLKRLQTWQTNIGELRVDPETQEIHLNLTSVDLEPILARVSTQDTQGNRKFTLREILFDMMRIPVSDQNHFSITHTQIWKGTKRTFEIQYVNVRERTDLREFQAGEHPRLILDYPFDEDNCTPKNDLDRLQSYRDSYGETTRTLVWLPRFLSRKTMNDLGRLIQVEHLLRGERLQQFTQHLALEDRPQAKILLENQRSGLRASLRKALEMAYGILEAEAGYLDDSDVNQLSQDQMLQSLHSAFRPRMPAAADLSQALEGIMAQELQAHYPAHPDFPVKDDISVALVRSVWKEVQSAVALDEPRFEVSEKPTREKLRTIAEPLRLGQMTETHFLPQDHWKQHLEQEMNKRGLAGTVKVGDLYEWIDLPKPMGLPVRLRSLIVHMFAEQTHRQRVRHGVVLQDFDPELAADVELRPHQLPSPEVWSNAWQRAKVLTPDLYPMQCSTANLRRLSDTLREALAPYQSGGRQLPAKLKELCRLLGVDASQCPRLELAHQGSALLDVAGVRDDGERIQALVDCAWNDPPEKLWALLQGTSALVQALSDTFFKICKSLPAQAEQRPEAKELLADAQQILINGDDVIGLNKLLQHIETHVPQWWMVAPPPPVIQPPPPPPTLPGLKLRDQGQLKQAEASSARTQLEKLLRELDKPGRRVTLQWELWEES